MSKIEKVVLAYSGGLDTSAILKWIKKTYECEVITMTADLGQGEELDGLADKALSISSLEKARGLQIGTVNQSVGEQFLLSKGFVKGKNLQASAKNELNYEKLRLGRIDLWIMNQLTAYHLVRQAGQNPEKALHKALAIPELSSQSYYMAFGAQTSDATVERFRKALESLQRNGSFDRLQRKWQ